MRHGGYRPQRERKGKVVEVRRAEAGSEVPAEDVLVLRVPARVSLVAAMTMGASQKLATPRVGPV